MKNARTRLTIVVATLTGVAAILFAQVNPSAPAKAASTSAAAVKLRAAQRVASVNGTAITGRHLIAWRRRDPAERVMTPATFAVLKQRAIERELTFAEARRLGIELTSEQRIELTDLAQSARARGETDAVEVDFEVDDARAQMLAAMLVDKAGGPRPPAYATAEDVTCHHETHADEIEEPQPAAGDDASTQRDLQSWQAAAGALEPPTQQELRAYLDKLRAAATITD